MPYTKRLGNMQNRLMNSQWVKLYTFARLLDNLCTQSYILVIYTLYSMITYGNLVGVSSRYSTTDLGLQRLLAKRPTVSPSYFLTLV
jgi:hypothetical protein